MMILKILMDSKITIDLRVSKGLFRCSNFSGLPCPCYRVLLHICVFFILFKVDRVVGI